MSASWSHSEGPFVSDFASNPINAMEEVAQLAFERSLAVTQHLSRTLSEGEGPFDSGERAMAQDELVKLCALYRALPKVDRVNLGRGVEQIFLLIAEELVWVEGSEGPEDRMLEDEVLRVFLGATTSHPLAFVNEWPEEGACEDWALYDGRRNNGGQTLTGSVIWLELPRRRTERCGCTSHEGTSDDSAPAH